MPSKVYICTTCKIIVITFKVQILLIMQLRNESILNYTFTPLHKSGMRIIIDLLRTMHSQVLLFCTAPVLFPSSLSLFLVYSSNVMVRKDRTVFNHMNSSIPPYVLTSLEISLDLNTLSQSESLI